MSFFTRWRDDDYRQANEGLAGKDTLDVLRWAYAAFGDGLVYACSFGAEGIVLLDLIEKVKADATVVFLDTQFHFAETYALVAQVEARYPRLRIEKLLPPLTPEAQEAAVGPALWQTEPDRCCHLRKIEPLQRRLSAAPAWITGLRREQSPARATTAYVNRDERFESVKICPLIHWTWDEVWQYIRAFDLPYNRLHDRGYPSIGCLHCTQPVAAGEDLRAGRWKGLSKTECGLHA